MQALQTTLFLWILFVCAVQLSVADTLRKALPESQTGIPADLSHRLADIPSDLFRREDQPTKDAGPIRQHRPAQLIDNGSPLHSGKLDDLGQKPRQIDLGPHRPSGQVPSTDGIRLTPLEILSGRKLGQQMSNRRGIDIGPQRPSGQIPPDDSDALGKLVYPGRQNDVSGPTHRISELVFSHDEGRTRRDGDVRPERPNGQLPPSVDLGREGPDGQDQPKGIERHFSLKRGRREVDLPTRGQVRQNDELLFSFSSESFDDDSTDNDIEVSPYAKISDGDSNRISSENFHDLGPHRPMGSIDPNGIPSPPSNLGPQRPSGQHPPSTVDLGPQRPSGQHPPSATDSEQVDLGPHRPNGATDPNGIPPPGNLGPQRPFGQHPPSDNIAQKSVIESFTRHLGSRRSSRAADPDGLPSAPSDLGPHRPPGQHPPSENETKSALLLQTPRTDLGPQRPSGQHPPPEDLSPQRPSGQHPPGSEQRIILTDPLEDASQKIVVYRSLPSDLGPHRPSGATDPNGIPSPPADLGPQRPSGQHPPPEDLGPQRPSGQHPPGSEQRIILTDPLEDASQKIVVYRSLPSDLGPHRPSGATDPNGIPSPPADLGPQRPSGQHPPPEDLGPQRPSDQHPPGSEQRIILTDPLKDASQKIVVYRSLPSDLGPHRPSGGTDPNGIPSPPADLGPQRPSGQHPPPEDLGPQRPSGQHPPGSEQRIISTDPLEDASQKIVVYRSLPSDLGPHRPSGATDPNGIPSPPADLGPQRPSDRHLPESEMSVILTDPREIISQKLAIYRSPPSELGSRKTSGNTDPNGIPTSPTDLGPQTPSGQLLPLPEDLGPSRPSELHPPKNTQRIVVADPLGDVPLLHSSPSDLGPHRPSGAIDPNGPPNPPSDLGPHRPSGQHPPRSEDPLRIESVDPTSTIDLGPHRPAGPSDPNIKPGVENDPDQSYKVYWNIPTFMCHKHGYRFSNLTDEYGIVQNPNDAFRGPRITILYDPGLFPAILVDAQGKKFLRNGGVPQEGDIQKHLAALEDSIEEQVPKDFGGLGVIDFEAWRPVWAQNWGTLNVYRSVSIDLEKRRDPSATRRALEIRAKVRFEAAARVFFEATVLLAQQLRPRGRWGFYGFPHCFNQVPTARPTAHSTDYTCAAQHQHQNDKIDWLWRASSALYPSVYLTKANKTAQDELAFVSGRLAEAQRVSKGTPVYAYVWYRYHDNGAFLNEDDLWSSLSVPHRLNLAGTILWGSSSDLNNRDKCARFSQVLQTSIGPAVARATER